MRLLTFISACSFLSLGIAVSPGADRIPQAGEPGSVVPSFQMRTVSGPLMNRSVCHVCRNGSRPVVMIVLRELSPSQRVLLRNLDRVVDKYRNRGLRAFAVYLTDFPRRDIPLVQTFQFNGRIDMPVGLSPETIGVDQLGVEESVPVSVILYHEQTLWKRFDFEKNGPDHKAIRELLVETEELLKLTEMETIESD